VKKKCKKQIAIKEKEDKIAIKIERGKIVRK